MVSHDFFRGAALVMCSCRSRWFTSTWTSMARGSQHKLTALLGNATWLNPQAKGSAGNYFCDMRLQISVAWNLKGCTWAAQNMLVGPWCSEFFVSAFRDVSRPGFEFLTNSIHYNQRWWTQNYQAAKWHIHYPPIYVTVIPPLTNLSRSSLAVLCPIFPQLQHLKLHLRLWHRYLRLPVTQGWHLHLGSS